MRVKTPEKGGIVQSVQGRDSGKFYVIVDVQGQYLYVADGKTRTLSNPKKKNVRHLRLMPRNISQDGIAWDGSFDNRIAYLLKGLGADKS